MRLGDFKLVAGEEEHELHARLRAFNRTATAYPRESTVHALFAEQAARRPTAVAVIHGAERLTYAEVESRASGLARVLVDSGVGRESFVAVMLKGGPRLPWALLGVLKAGAAYVPLETDTPIDRAGYVLRQTRAAVLVADAGVLDRLEALEAACPDLATVVLIDGSVGRRWPGRVRIVRARAVDAPGVAAAERAAPTSLAYVIYTSGTSGRPKGVMIEHRSIVRLVRDTDYIALGPDDRVLQAGAVAFDASTFEIWGPLLNGGAVCFPDDDVLDPQGMQAVLERQRITTLFLTTTLFNLLAGARPGIFAGLRTLLTGGEKVSVHHVNAVRAACPSLRLLHVYGPTENTTFTTSFTIDRAFEHDVPIGGPIANTTVYILDDALAPVPVGVFGELCTGGDGLARGYLDDPDLTAEKFVAHPLEPGQRVYRTGDVARFRPDGTIEFLGRRDGQVKVRGFRVELAEIEHQLLACGVRAAAVIAVDRGPESKELVAYVAGEPDLDASALRARVKDTLPAYMVPAHVVVVDTLPLTANGKLDRAALPPPPATASGSGPRRAPETETQRRIAAVWGEVLELSDVSASDDFFELGGHSLRAAKVVSLIHDRLGVKLPLTAVFEHPTVAALADAVVRAARFDVQAADQLLTLLRAPVDGPSVFAFPPATGDALSYAQLVPCLPRHNLHCFNFPLDDRPIETFADSIAALAPGPRVLVGYSGGGNIAYHVAGRLEARGQTVSCVVMFDAARRLDRVPLSADYARWLATGFLDDAGVRPFITSEVLREKVVRTVERYFAWLSDIVDAHPVAAPIHLIESENPEPDHRDAAGRVVASRAAWAEVTRGGLTIHAGRGDHNGMLARPYVEHNAALLERILARS